MEDFKNFLYCFTKEYMEFGLFYTIGFIFSVINLKKYYLISFKKIIFSIFLFPIEIAQIIYSNSKN